MRAHDPVHLLSRSAATLDVLIEIERLMDALGVFVYPEFEDAEIHMGPFIGRHTVRLSLLFPANRLPPAKAFARLLRAGIKVDVRPANIEYHIDDRDVSAVYPGSTGLLPDSAFRRSLDEVPVPESIPVALVTLRFPRELVDLPIRAAARRVARDLTSDAFAAVHDEGEERT